LEEQINKNNSNVNGYKNGNKMAMSRAITIFDYLNIEIDIAIDFY
jgi:hypothetical protein